MKAHLRLSLLVCSLVMAAAAPAGPVLAHAAPNSVPPLRFRPTVQTTATTAQPPLQYGGGPVQTATRIYVVYWAWHGVDPSHVRPYLESFLKGVGGSLWLNSVTQYCQGIAKGSTSCPASAVHAGNPSGMFQGSWADDTDPAPSQAPNPMLPGRPQLWTEVNYAVQHFNLDGTDVNNLIYIVYPHGTEIPSVACAFHEEPGTYSPPIPFVALSYTPDYGKGCGLDIVNPAPAGNLDGVSITAGHELAEAITDPDAGGGWLETTNGENGDKCAWLTGANAPANFTFPTGKFAVQPLWSNAANSGKGGCVMTYGTVTPPTPTPVPTVGPPGAAIGVAAQASGGGTATVSWTPPTVTGGAPITAYAVYGYSYTGSAVMQVTTNPTSMVETGLTPGASYVFTITPWNGHFWGGWSAWSPTWVSIT